MAVMNWMRGSLSKMIMWIILIAFLGTCFIWGMGEWGNTDNSRSQIILRVNGAEISRHAYTQAHSNLYRIKGPNLKDPKASRRFKQEVVDALIAEVLLTEVATTLGIQISTQDVSNYIARNRNFQDRAGNFSSDLFLGFLQRQAMSEKRFIADVREQLSRERTFSFFGDSALIGEEDLRWAYARINRQLKATYIDLNLDDISAKFKVNEKTVKTYYQRNKKALGTPAQVKTRHLLYTLAAEHTPEDEQAAKAFLTTIRERITKGELTFAKAAAEHSQDAASKSEGGELGWLKKGEVLPDFNVIFDLKKGEISQPVRTNYGLHLFLAEDIKKGIAATYKQARPKIVRILNQKRAIPELRRTQYRLSVSIKENDSLAEVAKKTGLKLKMLDWFGPESDLPGIESDQLFISRAETMEVGDISDPLPYQQGGFYYLQVTEERKGKFNKARWEEQQGILVQLAHRAKGEAVFQDFIDSLIEQAEIKYIVPLEML